MRSHHLSLRSDCRRACVHRLPFLFPTWRRPTRLVIQRRHTRRHVRTACAPQPRTRALFPPFSRLRVPRSAVTHVLWQVLRTQNRRPLLRLLRQGLRFCLECARPLSLLSMPLPPAPPIPLQFFICIRSRSKHNLFLRRLGPKARSRINNSVCSLGSAVCGWCPLRSSCNEEMRRFGR